MKRINLNFLKYQGSNEFFLLPTMGIKVVNNWYRKKICLCFAWLCFGLSIWLWTIKESDSE